MKTAGRKRSNKRKAKARKVIERKASKPGLTTDDEEVELRQARALQERAPVSRMGGNGEFYADYEVGSQQWGEPYRVEIRSLHERRNSCTCLDFLTNRLGTCKHIERVLQQIGRGRKRRMQRAAREGSPFYEVYLDADGDPSGIRLLEPRRGSPKARELLAPFFGANGLLLGEPVDALPAIERAISRAHPRVRGSIRVSAGIEPWRELNRKRRDRADARAAFLSDVRKGKRDINPVRMPLYPYQQEGMLHLAFAERAMLADEMGLGKTVQAIAACELLHQLKGIARVLVVCPASLKAEWEDQVRQFTGRSSRLIYGPRAERLRTYREEHFISIANYEQVRNDVEEINRYLAPDVVILDEAQRIKNWPTKTAKSIKRLQSPYAFVLTGTPLENRIEEIYSLIEFLDPLLFGALFRFQREFYKVDEEGNVNHRNLNELHRRVNSVMLRRRKADVEGELPARTTNTYFVGMDEEQRARYEDYETRAMRLIAQAQKRPLKKEEFELLQRLLACMRMVCDTPYILDRDCRLCPKLEELETILDEVLGDESTKVIIFSEWVRMLELVQELAGQKGLEYAEHTGRVDQRRRREEIRRFKQEPTCRLFLSSDSGSTGLNLQAANVVINLDLPWNPAKLEQRIARAWRKHQQRPVTVINLVTENSIEHGMLGRLAFKQHLADSVLDGQQGVAEAPASGRGRKAFLQRLNDLMGTRAGAEKEPEAARTADRPGRRLKEELCARFPSQVLGIDAAAGEGAFVIVARKSDEAEAIAAAARQAAPGAHIEVLDQRTHELLGRLKQQGIISFTAETTPLFRAPQLEAAGKERPAPVAFPKEARAHLASAERSRKTAAVLAEADLHREALAPLAEAYEIALESLHVLHTGARPSAAPSDEEIEDLAATARLSFDPLALRAGLRTRTANDADDAATVRKGLEAVAAIEQLLR